MEYCLQMRCCSEPTFEAVAENFVCSAEKHTTLQIAKQVVAMGRLNYLPQCSGQMFKKLESILAARFSQFQPQSLIDMIHACVHLKRFPLNYINKIFSPYFLQKLQDLEICLDENRFILPLSQWEQTYKRIALCLDGQNRFCNNTQHLLGKEATKRRYLHKIGYEVVQIPYFEFEKRELEGSRYNIFIRRSSLPSPSSDTIRHVESKPTHCSSVI